MNKKIAKVVIIILSILLMLQLIYYNLIREKNNSKISSASNFNNSIEIQPSTESTNSINNDSMQYKELFYPRLISELYDDNYKGSITKDEIAESIYKLTTGGIAKIYENIKNANVDHIEEYYYENISTISLLGIESEEDFLLICDEIKNVYRTSTIYSYSVIDIDTAKSEGGYYIFNLDLVYTNDLSIHLKCKLPEDNTADEIKYSSNSDINKIFERYKGVVTKDELINTMYEFMEQTSEIYKNTRLKSLNDEAKYFANNEDKLKASGIYTAKDFQNIAFQINQISWNNGTQLSYYRLSNYKETEEYATVDLTITYDLSYDIKITINLSQKEDISPSVKFSAVDVVGDDSNGQE